MIRYHLLRWLDGVHIGFSHLLAGMCGLNPRMTLCANAWDHYPRKRWARLVVSVTERFELGHCAASRAYYRRGCK